MRILFWGTPDFSVPSLRALLGESHEVVGVVTQPDRPAGRGQELRHSHVKQIAVEEMIPVLQPERAHGDEFMAQMRALEPEISVVIAYGQILRKDVLELPAYGSINAHASLLPALRGAAPINWAIIRGHDETGVTIIRMTEKMDAGPMLFQISEPIGPEETASDLWTRLSEISAQALVETLALIENGIVEERPQDESRVTFAPRIERADAHIDWSRDATSIANLMRGMDAIPGAWTTHRGAELKVFRPRVFADRPNSAPPGTILELRETDPAMGLTVACGKGALAVREVQPPGKRRMLTTEWLRGRAAQPGERFGA
ncbi:MAG TPA: methionyl-tRNA formyltransferase [Longimicrobiales bacterium]